MPDALRTDSFSGASGAVVCTQLPAGPHWVGTRGPDRFASAVERPLFAVTWREPVWLSRDLVTEADLARYRSGQDSSGSRLPAVGVSWGDAVGYCQWLAGRTGLPWRLPSEAEWEIACRAGTDTPFSTGDRLPVAAANYYYDESGHRVGPGHRTPVDHYPPNPWGFRDLHGNTAEWCADAWHPSYDGAAADGSPRPGADPSGRVVRGGAWDLLPRLLRSSCRDSLPPSSRRDNLGFRLALTLS